MKKRFTFLIAALMLLVFMMPTLAGWGQTKITDYTQIVSGKTYYIGATLSNNTDYFLYVSDDPQIGTCYGACKTDKSQANTFTFEGSGSSWTIRINKLDGTAYKYLGTLPTTSSPNGKLSIANTGAIFTASNTNSLIRLSNSNRSIQRNNAAETDRFGSYGNTQTDIWLMEVPAAAPSCEVSPTSWAIGNVQAGSSTQTQNFTVTADNLTAGLDFAIKTGTYYSITNGVTGMSSSETSKTIEVTFNPEAVGDMNDYLVISGTDFSGENAIRVPLTAHGLCNAPETALTFPQTTINLTIDNPEVTLAPTPNTGNSAAITYEVTDDNDGHGIIDENTGEFAADAIGTYVVTATQADDGATCGDVVDITIKVNGTDPSCTINPTTYNFGTVLTGSINTQDFTVTTANLTGDLTIAIDNTDKGFSILSPSPATIAQNATSTTVSVQYAPTTAGSEVTATLTISSGGITTQTATVKGTASDGNTITFDAGTGTCGTASLTNLPNYEFTLPTATAPEGWTFAGWCATNVSTATTIEPTLLTGSYIISGDATLYAVYSKTEGSGGNFEYVFKDQGYTNAQIIHSAEMDATSGIGWTATKGGNNGPAYYDTGTGLRVYNGGTFSITTNGNTITAVSLTFSSTSYTFSSSETTNPTIWSGSQSTNITWNVSRTCRLQKVKVTYNNSTTTYHTSPTAKVATPTIEIAGVGTGAANTYYEKATVTLACDTDDATIHYTTNGDDPTEGSDTYAAPFDVTNDAVIKAIAVKTNYTNSNVTSPQTINIVHRNATFTVGVYSTLNSSATFNEWYQYSVTGSYTWSWDSYGYARIVGSGDNEAWLISPKMSVENGKLAVSFDCVGRYANENQFEAYYSTNYPGYGNPTSSTWTEINQVLPYAEETWTFTTINENLTVSGNVYFAFVYKSTTSKAGTLEVKNFTAKQCYPVTYNKNGGGDGTMAEDPNSPYAVGATVTVLDCDFTAPEEPANMEFVYWSTQADGNGYRYYPDSENNKTFTMGTSAVELFAIWAQACTTDPVMAATTNNNEYVNDGGAKSWTINLGSSITSVGTGGCEISEYGFVYSMVNNPPTTSDTKITLDIPGGGVSAGDIEAAITEAAESTTYYVRSYAINNHGIGYGPLSTITTNAFPKYQIDYYINSTTKSYSKEIYQGDAITATELPDVSGSAPDGFTFMGWKSSVIDGVQNDPPTYVAVDDVLEANSSFYAVFAIETNSTGTVPASLEIVPSDFSTNGYAANDGDHEKSSITYNTSNVYQQSSNNIQFKTNSGYLFNKTELAITSVVLTNISQGSFTVYSGTSEHPTIGAITGQNNVYSITDNTHKYITVKAGDNTPRVGKITINYNATGIIKVYSNFCTSVESISGNENIDEETGILTDDVIVNEGVFYVDEIIIVPDGKKLEITGTGSLISPVAENLIIEEGGQLIIPNNATVAATFIKNVPEKTSKDVAVTGWTLISSPTTTTGQAYESFESVTNLTASGYLLYNYDEENRIWRSSQTTGHTYSTLNVGQGYLYGNSTGTAIEFTGNVNSAASYLVDLSYNEKDSDKLAGFNLIGNPFSHEIAWSNGVTLTGGSISDGYYKIDGEGFSATLCTENIAPLQGILVKANATGQSVTFNNVMPLAKGEQANHDNIMFKVENSECSDVAYALFDKGYGLNKISHRGDMVPMLYIPQNGENYAIAMMDDNTNSFNLGFEAKTTAKYTLTYKAKGEFNYLHVIDRMTGEDIDMLLEGEYSFVGSPQDDNNRFIVRLGYLPNYDDNGEDTFAYQNGSDIVVSGEGELQIFDVMGRKVASITINGVETVNIPTQGVYIMKLNEKTQKIVVR